MPSSKIEQHFKSSNSSINAQWAKETNVTITLDNGVNVTGSRCHLRFYIPDDMSPPVLFYYFLTNFYQNHRRYAESMDADQLKGDARSYGDISGSKCTPLYGAENNGEKKPYYPCGLIANSMFNDTFSSPKLLKAGGGNETSTYNMSTTGIAWDSDKDLYGETKYNVSQIIPPPNWALRYPKNYTADNPPPNLKNWEAFQVWMRTAGLPTFSKLYQRNDKDTLQRGQYEIVIDDRTYYLYLVLSWLGTVVACSS